MAAILSRGRWVKTTHQYFIWQYPATAGTSGWNLMMVYDWAQVIKIQVSQYFLRFCWPFWIMSSRGWFNIKMSSYQYGKCPCGDKMISWLFYLQNGSFQKDIFILNPGLGPEALHKMFGGHRDFELSRFNCACWWVMTNFCLELEELNYI